MCRRKLSWDEKMSDTEVLQWEAWLQQFTFLPEFKLRRSLIPPAFGEGASFQLHHFSDASQTGYGVASYLRVVSTDGEVHCTLLMGRARVAPLKRLSIPRAELTAASVAAQQDSKMKTELDIDVEDSFFWTDSTTVLKYLFNESARYQTFVSNESESHTRADRCILLAIRRDRTKSGGPGVQRR
ncbi:uncharacterized protein [Macrobrachium rosenbergii]|uniref:uncharacterized protein n=1 Tax=Macrobrachium rosenbergii TaxID=79674 RepID=UPI0034D649FB